MIAADAAGNASAPSGEASGTAQADTTPPTVSVTAPAAGSTVSGIVSVTASASDDVGVQSVQFKLDGANLGAADTTAPYDFSWDTRGAAQRQPHAHRGGAPMPPATRRRPRTVAVTVNNPTATAGLVASYGFEEASGTTAVDQLRARATPGTINGATWSPAASSGARSLRRRRTTW